MRKQLSMKRLVQMLSGYLMSLKEKDSDKIQEIHKVILDYLEFINKNKNI